MSTVQPERTPYAVSSIRRRTGPIDGQSTDVRSGKTWRGNSLATHPLPFGNSSVYVRLVCVVVALALFVVGMTVVAHYTTELVSRSPCSAVTR
jgi:hypothetical protein